MALFSTILTTKPAFATDNSHRINNGSVKCPEGSTPEQDGNSGWWGCSWKSLFPKDPVITCTKGWGADFKTGTRKNEREGIVTNYKLGHCVEDKSSTNKSTVEKNAEVLANKAGKNGLVTLIASKIEASPWYLGLSDADKVAAGCKTEQLLPGTPSPDKALVCDDAAKKKLAKMLIGTCIASAVKTVTKRTNGDTGSDAMDAVFTSCLAGNSGVDAASINKEKGEIAWDDIKKDVDISEKKDEDGKPKNSCSADIGPFGWFICPSMSLGANLADAGYSSISMFLDISPDIFSDNPELGGAKQAWNFFRDIANVVFVLLFLWVIFSQISNVGVSNYGIKKILPKLILGAILINLSFYICQLAVDLSNILGYALKGVLEGASLKAESKPGIGSGIVVLVAEALAGTGAAVFAFLTVSIPMIIWTLLSIAVALLILVFRQAAVILLIAISPIAFAAWLLPNTESLFKKWVSAFKGLLVVFPVVSLMYGSGKLAGAVLSNSSGGIMQFVAMCVPILPLMATPFVIKSSLNSLGSIGAKISNNGLMNLPSNKLKDNVMNKSRFADAKKSFDRYSAKKLAERRSGNSWAHNLKNSNNKFASTFGKVMTIGTTLDNTEGFGRKLGLSEAATNYQEAYDKAAMEMAERALTYKYGGDAAKALNDKDADKYIRIAAVNQLKGQGTYGADKIAEYLSGGGKVDSVSMAKSLTDMKGSHAGVAKAGSEALQELQKEGGLSEINFSSDQFNNLTASGVSELSNKDIAGQSAKAIKKSNITADKATEILSNDILYSSANDAVISALKEKGGKRIIPQTPQNDQNNQQDNNSQQDNQNNQQGNNSQQSSQNNQQSNSSSGGGIILPTTEDINKYGR